MLGIRVPEAENVTALEPLGWKRLRDSGLTSTNGRLNDLDAYVHSRRHGIHAYAFEIAEQLRQGPMSREDGEEKLRTLATTY